MRLRTAFLLCFAVACLPAVGWSAWIALRAQSEWADAASAVRAAEAMGHALHLVEALSVERGALQEHALSAGPGTESLAEIAAANDALLDRTQRSMQAAGLPSEAVTRAREILVVSRARVADAIKHPLAERDPKLVPAIMTQLYERLSAVEEAMALAERGVARANPSIGAFVAVGSLAVEMRAAAGRRSSHLSGWFGGRAVTTGQLDDAMHMTGQVQHAWDRLQRQVLIVGSPPRLERAVATTRAGFFSEAEPRYREFLAIARAGGERPMSLRDWRRWTIAALPGTLAARDAAIAEAVEHGEILAGDAQLRLMVAAAATSGLLVLAGGSLLVLLRRQVLPIQRLTLAVKRLARGDVATEVPERGRSCEIGDMAAAIEVFRGNAVELHQTNLRFDAALSNMSQGLAMYDAEERLIVANPRLTEILGVPPGSLQLGMKLRDVLAVAVEAGHFRGRTLDEVYAERRESGAATGCSMSFEDLRGERWIAISSQPMTGGGWLLTFEDITERRRSEACIAHMAHHDALTGLPNRVLFRTRVEEALGRARRGEGFAVLYLDLDRFKAVNDTLGHAAGDALLKAVSVRLRAELRETDTAARLGGDELAILQASVEQPRDATSLAQRVIEVLAAPYTIEGTEVEIGVSVGIAIVSDESSDLETLLRNADLALYRAKADGRGTWRCFEPEMNADLRARQSLETDLRRALVGKQFELHYQPLLDLRTHRVNGFEALLRWRHPERGLVSPAVFIPVAEEIGLIQPIGEWVLQRACTEAAGWPQAVKIAVNVSAVQLKAGRRLIDTVVMALRTSGLPAERLELEITETAVLQDTDETSATLDQLRMMGVRIAMDDFGTGYSSLSHLSRFPFDKVKIDQSFIRGLGRQEGDCAAIVRAVMGLCANLGIAVTAEGVETEEQLAWLSAEGPCEGQGYLFSRPVPAESVPRVLETLNNSAPRDRVRSVDNVDMVNSL